MTALALLLLACEPHIVADLQTDDTGSVDDIGDGGVEADGDGGGADTGAEDFSEYDGATLVVVSPGSGDFYPLDEGVPFIAHLYAADGSELPADDLVTWSTSVDSSWSATGTDFVDDLPVGVHDISAVASLPNGDRLGWTVGDVRVQHQDAGTYVGDLMVDFSIEYKGVPYTATCIGAATLIVDAWGETAIGESSCTTSLLGYDLSSDYSFDFAIEDAQLEGEAILDLTWFESQFSATGTLGDGELHAEWADSFMGFLDFAGELELARISLDTE